MTDDSDPARDDRPADAPPDADGPRNGSPSRDADSDATREGERPRSGPGSPAERPHRFSEGGGFSDPYEGFDLDPPELTVDPNAVDPVDSYGLADVLDERQLAGADVDSEELLEVGVSYMEINRFEQATETFERAARFADDDTLEAEAWVNKGIAHAQLEEYEEAIDSHREALYVDPEGEYAASAHTNLAYALWEHGEDEEAFRHAEEGVKADERLPHAWYNLGFIEVERGLYEDAADCLENAVRLGFRSPEVFEEQARVYEALGREAEAEDATERAEQARERLEDELVG